MYAEVRQRIELGLSSPLVQLIQLLSAFANEWKGNQNKTQKAEGKISRASSRQHWWMWRGHSEGGRDDRRRTAAPSLFSALFGTQFLTEPKEFLTMRKRCGSSAFQ